MHTPHKQETALFHVPQTARKVSSSKEGAARQKGARLSFSPGPETFALNMFFFSSDLNAARYETHLALLLLNLLEQIIIQQ